MGNDRKLFFFALVAATAVACSRAFLWTDQDFSAIDEWPLRRGLEAFAHSNNRVAKDTVCRTEECRKVADRIVGSMNQSVNPCENFYEFTCGKWSASNPIMAHAVESNPLRIYRDLVLHRISKILKTEPDAKDILPVRQAKLWYRSCTTNNDRQGLGMIYTLVKLAGGWPMTSNDRYVDENSWQRIDRYYASWTGHNTFYDVVADPPTDGSRTGKIIILPPDLLVERKHLVLATQYRKLVESAIKLYRKHNKGPRIVLPRSDNAKIRALVLFERRLLKLITDNEVKNINEHVQSFIPLNEFVRRYEDRTGIDRNVVVGWREGIQDLFKLFYIKLDPTTPTLVKNIGYVEGLSALLKKTPRETIVNYIHWNFMANMLLHTTEHMRDTIFHISAQHQLYGVKKREPRWMECLKSMKMTHASAYAYSQKYFPESAQRAAREMTDNILINLEANIDYSNWVDGFSKPLVKDIFKNMAVLTKYPQWYNNRQAVTNYYSQLVVGPDNIGNILRYMIFERRQKLMPYTMPEYNILNKYATLMDPITVNLEYFMDTNVLNTPPAIFQWPVLTPELPDNVNYGRTGYLIGYELSDAYNETGISSGEDGYAVDFSVNAIKSYYQRAECFADQYNTYFSVDAELEDDDVASEIENGVNAELEDNDIAREIENLVETSGTDTKLTININDSTGLQAVFQAYKNLKGTKEWTERKLPGLEKFTNDQLFFIAFGSFSCGSVRPAVGAMLRSDSIESAHRQVNGAVSNTNDFAEIFNCPLGSPMNPTNKCDVWKKT